MALCTNDYIANLPHFHNYFHSMLSILLTWLYDEFIYNHVNSILSSLCFHLEGFLEKVRCKHRNCDYI